MSKIQDHFSYSSFYGKKLYIFLSMLASVPVFLVILSFVKTINVHQEEAISVAATLCFMAGIFAGRYIYLIWSPKFKSIPMPLVTGLSILIGACFIWLFIHADFPFEGRAALNLLLFWLPFILSSVACGGLIKLIRSVTQNQLKEARTLAEHSKSELHLLQSQLSPHFLFNTLNNLYGLSLTEHERIPLLLLKLSDLLRYSVYDANEIYVPLKDEMVYIRNYIEFEKIRIGDRLILTTDLEEIVDAAIKIAPMLLIIFIENAFKHSKNNTDNQIFIKIELKTWGNSILCVINNSHNKQSLESKIDQHSGFGLASVHKRLELLYPNEHELVVEDKENFYKVALRLKKK